MIQTTSETQPSRSFNLDGGGSPYNAKLDANGNKEEMRSQVGIMARRIT
jgi:hypothetical protein